MTSNTIVVALSLLPALPKTTPFNAKPITLFSSFPSLLSKPFKRSPLIIPIASSSSSSSSFFTDFSAVSDGFDDDGVELDGDTASPWEGAVVYRRDASASHVEYATTLERLGLAKLSTQLSRSRAAAMGIRLASRRMKDESVAGDDGTPVLVSLDVTRRKRRLKLDGIVRTVITLGCNRCAEPAAEGVFSNFTLLLTEDPIEDSDEINMGVIYGLHQDNAFAQSSNDEEGDEKLIDLDDRLYFPAEEKEIDISKHIRDIVHVEVTIAAVCDASCKGLCLRCGTNLNISRCNCSKEEVQDKEYGPLRGLRKQMQQT